MNDIGGAESVTVETIPNAAVEAAVLSQEPKAQERDWEAEARKMGNWTPKEEWKGDPANWKDAKTYVEHGENIIRLTKGELAQAEKRFNERIERIEKVNKVTVARLQADYASQLATLTQQRKEAVTAGDAEAFTKADKAIEALKNDAPAKVEEPKTGDADEKTRKFAADNPWFVDDPDMHDYAVGWSERNAALKPNISFEDNAIAVVEAVQRKFPDRFKTAAANRDAAVDGGSSFSSPAPRNEDQTLLNRLPNEARAKCKEDMAAHPKTYPTVKSWVTVYES